MVTLVDAFSNEVLYIQAFYFLLKKYHR